MPELPEVETVRRGLQKLIIGKQIVAETHDTDKSFPNEANEVAEFLLGTTVTNVRRRAKVLLIDLSSNYTLITHLKMTGQLVFVGEKRGVRSSELGDGAGASEAELRFGAGHPNESLIGNLPDKSTRVIIYFGFSRKGDPHEVHARKDRSAQVAVDMPLLVSPGVADTATSLKRWQSFGIYPGAGQRDGCLFFNDQRKFGWMRLLPTISVPEIDFMKRVGPEPLEDDFTAKVLYERLQRRKNTSIKAALLDQTVLAGIGNIYADESLWGAKIHPATLVRDIPAASIFILHSEILSVLRLSLAKGGSTDRNYVNAEGKKGSYIDFARVFRREGQPCPRCDTTIEKIRVAGRGTHVCPNCQKLT
ncbi:MAG: DNA-formamidopyrimidine glycosylase family protein [Candidatus Saccharimonadales bacterium]